MAEARSSADSAPEYAKRDAADKAIGTAANTAPGGKVLEARDAAADADRQKALREGDANALKTSASEAQHQSGGADPKGSGGGKVEE